MPDFKARLCTLTALAAAVLVSIPATSAFAQNEGAAAAEKPKITVEAPDDTVVATVNGEDITKGQLMEALWSRYAIPSLTDLIDKTIIRQAGEEAGVDVSEADIDEKVEELKTRMPPEMTFDQFLSQYNMTEDQLRNELATSVYVERAAGQDISVTDQDLAGYIRARHILLSTQKPGQTPEEREQTEQETKARLEQIIADIKEGKITFAEAAQQHSEDPGSRDKGGDLGFFKRGVMDKEFENAAFNLKAGEMSEPVKSFYGYHVIQVEELGRDAEGEEREKLEESIRQERLRPAMTAWYMRVKQNADVERAIGEQPAPPPTMMPPEEEPDHMHGPNEAPANQPPANQPSNRPAQDTPPPPPPPPTPDN